MFWNQIISNSCPPRNDIVCKEETPVPIKELEKPEYLSEPIVDKEENICENYNHSDELKCVEEQFYKDFNEIMAHAEYGESEAEIACKECMCKVTTDGEEHKNARSEDEECFHVIIHELISAMSDLSKPMDHEVLNSLIDQLPRIKGVEYPSSNDCPDTCVRQGILLKLMTKVYEGVSRKCMETQCVPNDLYRDQVFLHEILTLCCCEEESGDKQDGCKREKNCNENNLLDFSHCPQ